MSTSSCTTAVSVSESERQAVLKAMGHALNSDNMEVAKELLQKFSDIPIRKADPPPQEKN